MAAIVSNIKTKPGQLLLALNIRLKERMLSGYFLKKGLRRPIELLSNPLKALKTSSKITYLHLNSIWQRREKCNPNTKNIKMETLILPSKIKFLEESLPPP